MAAFPGFGVLLARLLDHRRMAIGSLAQTAGVSEFELRSVLSGRQPGPAMLKALAPALNLHAADLFAVAGLAVPDELAPVDASASRYVEDLVTDAICLPQDQRSQLHRLIRSLPQEPRKSPFKASRVFDPHEAGFGAMVGNMLYANRNLGPAGAAKVLACTSNGRMYVAASTILRIASGKSELTSDRLANMATLLDFPVSDLAAITGIVVPDESVREDPAAADVAALIWEARRLTTEQMRVVCDQADAMRLQIPDDAIDRKFFRANPYRTTLRSRLRSS
ncbi:hypothetical protein [Actinomadura fibrosa]|uniref:HTH cro/C1-type domain-containing protein n=1 Tax=Actinomadura fibrosa TaxID=111802 RepID=A0ABW2Y2F6_9ACTN|nr:hypothetical protein [Actinomadura fibrosa]